MAFNSNPIVTAITGYTEEHKSDLLVKALLGGKSRGMFNLMAEVKGDTTLNLMENDVVFQPLDCGFNHSGSTTYSQRLLHPVGIKVNMEWCDKNLLTTYQNHLVKIAAGKETLPYEEKIVNNVVDKINEGIEKMLYQGQSGQTNEFEGLISILENDANTIAVSATAASTAYAFLKDVAAAIPAEVKNPKILVGKDLYYAYIQDLVAANLYHYEPNTFTTDGSVNEYRLPGTDIVVVAVDGLIGTNRAIASNMDNIFYGCDSDEDSNTFEFWFSQDNRTFRFVCNFLMGVQVAFPDLVVLGTKASE